MNSNPERKWGPSDQREPNKWGKYGLPGIIVIGAAMWWLSTKLGGTTAAFIVGSLIVVVVVRVIERAVKASRERPASPAIPAGKDPLTAVRDLAATSGGGVYLGTSKNSGAWRFARSERAVLLVGPPRSGKTSGVIIPAVIAHSGPVLVTSTKPDIARATAEVRSPDGKVWLFDPTGTTRLPGLEVLRWSPVTSCRAWDGAVVMARAMTANVGAGTQDRSHWASRAQALLGPLLHAAAVHGRGIDTVVDWVMRHELDDAGVLLEDDRCSKLAFGSLVGLLNTEARELSSIFSACADAVQAYTSEGALNAAKSPNFDPAAFVKSRDSVFISAAAEDQASVSPVVCGLLSEIRRETYRAHAAGRLKHRVLFALDEVANIAPLGELPQIASEGGGQGLALLAALQDLSQARSRWGAQADGFLTLFGTKLLLPGIADKATLEAVSTMLGEYDRKVLSHTHPQGGLLAGQGITRSRTTSTQRTRILSEGEVAGIPAACGLHLDGTNWELLRVTPAHRDEPWRTLTSPRAR
jgi:type IV secretory pathway TraG/TraD family ATPase VirD4